MIDTTKGRIRREADELEREWATDPRWAGVERPYSGEDVVRLRGSVRVEHTMARIGADATLGAPEHARVHRRARSHDGQPSRRDDEGGAGGDLLLGLAGGGRREPVRSDLSRPIALPRELGAGGRAPVEQRADARRPDRVVRGSTTTGCCRRSSPTPRPGSADPECVRADARDDRGRRGRRALRGPARQREEVRAPRREGARPDGAVHPNADGGAAGGRRARRAHARRRPHRCAGRDAHHVRRRRARPRVPDRRAHTRGYHRVRDGLDAAIARGWPTLRSPTCCGARPRRRTSTRHALRRGDPRRVPGKLLAYNCSPSFNWKQHLDDADDAQFQKELARWATASSSSRSRGSTR